MPYIGASSIMGVALETVSGTYELPDKFVPFDSESLNYTEDTVWRRPIRNTPGLVGATPGNARVEGDITIDALHDVVPYFLAASRCTVVKTGLAPDFVYTFTPSSIAVPERTMSVTIRRGPEIFGYRGLVVGSFTLSIEDGALKFSATMIGRDEEEVTDTLTPVWPTSDTFGAGMYNLQIPTGTQVFDTDTFSFQSEDNASAQYRLHNNGRGAQFISFGESTATLSVERDFENRAQYDLYRSLTKQAITLRAEQSASRFIEIAMPATIAESYQVQVPGQGDLVRASVSYQGAIDATGKHYQIAIGTNEDVAAITT